MTGTPTVQVTNTPNVQVTNTPNVQVTNTPNVLVTNSASNPVIIQNRDSTARNPYYSENFCNQPTNGYCLIDLTTVPAGMRLVIEYVTVLNQMPAAGTITSMDLRKKGTNVIVAFLPTAANPVNTNYTTSEKILAYFDAGETPEVLTFTNSAAGFTSIATVSGYLINIP